jgi:hypothetical protein
MFLNISIFKRNALCQSIIAPQILRHYVALKSIINRLANYTIRYFFYNQIIPAKLILRFI